MVGRRLAVLLAVAAVAATGCDDGQEGRATPSSPTRAGATGTAATVPPEEAIVAPSPEVAAAGLYSAWASGKRAAARPFASDRAIEQLFAEPFTAPLEFRDCERRQRRATCRFTYEAGTLVMEADGSEDEGFRIVSVRFAVD